MKVILDKRIGRVKELFGVEYAGDWSDELLEPITAWVLRGILPKEEGK